MNDVLTTAYAAAGCPVTSHDLAGTCARCGTESDGLTLATGRRVISEQFTAFDGWHNPSGGRGLCQPCTWSLTAPQLRQHPHLVTRSPAAQLRQLTRRELADLLTAPLTPAAALIVPLRPGRKYLLPEATWGHVITDDARLPWTAPDTERLAALQRLRAAGFGSRMLAADAPPWPAFRTVPADRWPQVLADWELLKPWRSRPPWLDLALHATTTTTRSAA